MSHFGSSGLRWSLLFVERMTPLAETVRDCSTRCQRFRRRVVRAVRATPARSPARVISGFLYTEQAGWIRMSHFGSSGFVPGEGSTASANPRFSSSCRALAAVRRVYDNGPRKLGSCCVCASATSHNAGAASGYFSSHNSLPEKAGWALRQTTPVRFSWRPNWTESRLTYRYLFMNKSHQCGSGRCGRGPCR
jgi:hypothetical protein